MIRSWHRVVRAFAPALLALSACSPNSGTASTTGTFTGGGGGKTSGATGGGSTGSGMGGGGTRTTGARAGAGSGGSDGAGGGQCARVLMARVRDRAPDPPDSNPDFENPNGGTDANIVAHDLGADNTPQYA